MAKTKYEKLEEKVAELMKEEDLHIKINEFKERKALVDQELAKLNSQSLEEISVKGNKYKSKEEYEEDLKRREDERDNGLIKKIDPLLKEQKDLEAKITLYDNFRANKDAIYNIMEYQRVLQEKNTRLNEELENAQKQSKGNNGLLEEYEKTQKRIEELNDPDKNGVNRIDEIKVSLKKEGLTDEERNNLLMEMKELQDKKAKDDEEYIKLTQVKKPELQNEFRDINEISKDIKDVEKQIDKCNAIWTCLLYGKDWKEIQSVLIDIDMDKDRENVHKIGKAEPDAAETENNEKPKSRGFSIFNPRKSEDIVAESIPTENSVIKNKVKPEEVKLPIEYEPFEKKHPILAKIPLVSRIARRRYDKKISKMKAKDIEKMNKAKNGLAYDPTNGGQKIILKARGRDPIEYLKYIDEDRQSMGDIATFMNIAKKGYKKVAEESKEKTAKDRLADKINYKNKEESFKESLKVEGIQSLVNTVSDVNGQKTQERVNEISEEVKKMVNGEEGPEIK